MKQLKDILAGSKKSTTTALKLGDKPGVDYAPKPKAERDIVAKHSIETHDDRVGNGDDIYQATNVKKKLNKVTNKGYEKGEDEKVYESAEDLEEVITKNTSVGDIIKDFRRSKDPKFEGKTQAERTRMALGASYAMQKKNEQKTPLTTASTYPVSNMDNAFGVNV